MTTAEFVWRSVSADDFWVVDVIDAIEDLFRADPAPTHLRADNGLELIFPSVQEWCTGNRAGVEFIPPGLIWVNHDVKSFISRFRNECLNIR